MRKRYLTIGSLAFLHFFAKAQTQDTTSQINKTQIEVVYNHYIQEGNNSAVTGGIGTEMLMVYGPSFSLKRTWGKNSLQIIAGADIISSASTDNIDFEMSSASIMDTRSYSNVVYERTFNKKNISIYGGMGFSIESDYFSISSHIGFRKADNKKLANYSAEFQYFSDDLRWGRLDIGEWRPQKLIYPEELRYQEWYDTYRRNSYNLKLGYTKVINKRAVFGVFPVFTYQNGLLSTPFHRIYLNDQTQAVENLPEVRYKASLGLKWNQFLGGRYILKNTINPYADKWGIIALTLENETAIKINATWVLLPNVRAYFQKGSKYFAPYQQHDPQAKYYTSDYDLATNQTYGAGIGIKYSPHSKLFKKTQFNALIFRYNFMHRTNNLNAHVLSLVIQLEKEKTPFTTLE